MTPRALLAALALSVAAFARAQDDPIARAKAAAAAQKALSAAPADSAASGPASAIAAAVYASERDAAVGFVDLARKFPEQKTEYCAYVLRAGPKEFRLSPVRQGDMNRCPADRPKPSNAVASVHTHPTMFGGAEVSVAAQCFSDGDYAFSESDEMKFPIYLGAPAGHVLRYAPGGTVCKGRSFVRRNFEVVRDLRPSVIGRLPVNPGVDSPLFTTNGQPIPRPSYCRDAN